MINKHVTEKRAGFYLSTFILSFSILVGAISGQNTQDCLIGSLAMLVTGVKFSLEIKNKEV